MTLPFKLEMIKLEALEIWKFCIMLVHIFQVIQSKIFLSFFLI
jgi:hypothetical protein